MLELGITLRKATLADRERAYDWLTRPGIVESMLGPPHFPDCPVPSRAEFLDDWQPYYFEHQTPEQGRVFVIRRGERDVGFIAHSELLRDAAGRRGAELDLWLSDGAECGLGYGSAGVCLLCALLEDELALDFAILQPSARNPRAIRAYLAAGFSPCGLPAQLAARHYGVTPDAHDAVFLARELVGHTRLVRAPRDLDRASAMSAFALADDSERAVLGYRDLGSLWLLLAGARDGAAPGDGAAARDGVLGHVLTLPSASDPSQIELVNLAIREPARRRGLGRRMLLEVAQRLAQLGARQLHVATAAADAGALYFYQRLGFRVRAVERDAFTVERGYPLGLSLSGVPVLDRVWLDRPLSVAPATPRTGA